MKCSNAVSFLCNLTKKGKGGLAVLQLSPASGPINSCIHAIKNMNKKFGFQDFIDVIFFLLLQLGYLERCYINLSYYYYY